MLPRTSAGIIRLNQNAAIELFCSHGFRNITADNSMIVRCVEDTSFAINGAVMDFSEIACNAMPAHTARRTNRTCRNGEIAEIGYNVGSKWLNLMDVCHEPILAATRWVHYHQNPWNRGFQRGFPRIPFIQGDFFDRLPVNTLYTRARQRYTIGNILGSQDIARAIVQETGDLFLARGHLAARTDYMFGSHQQGTFYFLNAAPQWQTFNAGNWERVESGLRNQVDRMNWNIEVYTGTYGVLRLKDAFGEPHELYLDHHSKRIPVPKIFYKVAIEHSLKAGIVFIGVNHPYVTHDEIKMDFTYCNDVSDRVDYIPWNRQSIRVGYSYACEVADFAKRVIDLPALPMVNRLLV